MVLFGEEKDWKEFLEERTQTELANLISRAKKHRSAYMHADDVKVAQVWSALTEISRQMKDIDNRLGRLETAIRGITSVGEVAKREALEDRVKEFIKPRTAKEEEEISKIVDALMKF